MSDVMQLGLTRVSDLEVLRQLAAKECFSKSAALLRAAKRRSRPFNRVSASAKMRAAVEAYWQGGSRVMLSQLRMDGAFKEIQEFVTTRLDARALNPKAITKGLDSEERRLAARLLAKFDYFREASQVGERLMADYGFVTFNQAATHALGNLGIKAAEFELKNEGLKAAITQRSQSALFATRNHADRAFETVLTHFYELGNNPYDQSFVDQIAKDLNYQAGWEARRFALTETGIVAEVAQHETYKRNGVEAKQWNATGVNTRDSHLALNGAVVPMDAAFDVDGQAAKHPLDPKLSPDETVNCHCWLSPVVDSDFEVDPARIWEGA
jgi:hypothetical protein